MFEFEQVTAKTESTLDSFGSGAKCGKVYYEKVKPNPNKMQTVVEMNLRRQSNTPGPMHYDTAAAFAASHHRAPSPLVFRAQKEVVNACLLRKRYFEEKAEAAREEHDDQRDASDSLLRKRVPSVFISDAKPPINRNYSKQSFSSGDEKSSIRMSAVKEILQAEDLWDSDDDRFGAELGKVDESATAPAVYSVSYSQVETRPRDSVAMAKGVATKQAFEQMLVSKPGVAKAMAEKR
jgi:hypothetical protein